MLQVLVKKKFCGTEQHKSFLWRYSVEVNFIIL